MSVPGGTAPASGLNAEILAEHCVIREHTQQLEKLKGLHELLGHLAEFRPVLVAHFLKEEATEGFYEQIRAIAPRHLHLVDALQHEHEALISEVDRLTTRANECLAGPIADILGAARRLASTLRKHEANEDEMFLDLLYTDLGQD